MQDPKDWRWSSYRAHAYGEKDAALDSHELYDALGKSDAERANTYRAMIAGRMQEKGLGQKTILERGLIAGSQSFVENVLHRWQLRHTYYRRFAVCDHGETGCCLGRPAAGTRQQK